MNIVSWFSLFLIHYGQHQGSQARRHFCPLCWAAIQLAQLYGFGMKTGRFQQDLAGARKKAHNDAVRAAQTWAANQRRN